MKRLLTVLAIVAASGAIVGLTVAEPTASAANGGSSYLCWNHEMVNPVAYLDSVADAMWATGKYIEPQAILGNVVGGTNIGAWSGGGGRVPLGPPVNGDDLNICHIWAPAPHAEVRARCATESRAPLAVRRYAMVTRRAAGRSCTG